MGRRYKFGVCEECSNDFKYKSGSIHRFCSKSCSAKNNRRRRPLKPKEKCTACDKVAAYTADSKFNAPLCEKHYSQMTRHGKILTRTRYDKNEIITQNEYSEIVMYTQNGIENGRAIIDTEDVDKVSIYKWHIDGNGYVSTATPYKSIYLHRLIMNVNDSSEVDHIFHNKLDCRKSKLRATTPSQNNVNKPLYKLNTSGVKGVLWNKRSKKWNAIIQFNKKVYWLGSYTDKVDAINARKCAEVKYHGEFAYKEVI